MAGYAHEKRSAHNHNKDLCVVRGCEREAEIAGKCRRCYQNVWYHVRKGPLHLAMWSVQVRLKSARLPHMEDEL